MRRKSIAVAQMFGLGFSKELQDQNHKLFKSQDRIDIILQNKEGEEYKLNLFGHVVPEEVGVTLLEDVKNVPDFKAAALEIVRLNPGKHSFAIVRKQGKTTQGKGLRKYYTQLYVTAK